ncbi:NAD(P)/FAD-dependent oxidoreductase [Rhodococcus koreensis]|uniref:3-phenylpropionate/trans-cinnamate dioxygenase ferredoxin reductase subunit n=1 Tax=Rhodococcus koreensis TaxID=99653 RepID=A0A1H4X1E5_9NOCA|nr:FAD-dependent oxidoreductase [Rhodococcus koreensis]SEC99486.1 3-phenylpropionate/trans-cinnamate dioxygenase ferredoxin reductase subunit [Rhodococcus koreensis]
MEHIVIVGAGHAGTQLAESLRHNDFTAAITLVNAEAGLPYQRPPLSKDHLAQAAPPEPLPLKTHQFLTDHDITLIEATSVLDIDRTAGTVHLSNGENLRYSELVLATGARNRLLAVPGTNLSGIHYLRTADDASRLHDALATARTVAVVGAGFIGLEFAAAARARGLGVTVIEHHSRPMARAVSADMSQVVADTHAADGIRLVLGESITAFDGDGTQVSAVLGQNSRRYPADLVVVGIGVEPATEVATTAGLATEYGGILVDAFLRTNDEHIWAIGDCAEFPCPHAGTPTRRESVQNAVDHARTLARTLTGSPTEYSSLPWFWSNQGRIKLQIAGIGNADDLCIPHGDPHSGRFSVYRFRQDKLTCVESLNNPAVHIAARKALAKGTTPTPAEVTADGFDLKHFVAREPTSC